MRKFVFTLLAVILCTATSYSQLSQRDNDAVRPKLGARPVAGDMALTFGYDIGGINGIASLPVLNQLMSGDFLTFKRYSSAEKAMRLGIRLYKDAQTLSGDLTNPVTDASRGSVKYKYSNNEYILVPGLEKHFNKSNIFDVYAGSDLYIGYISKIITNNVEQANGDYNKSKETTSGMVLGLGGVVGFNIFIAQLPVSLGLEYGLNLKWSFGGKTKHKDENSVGGVTNTQEYYSSGDFETHDITPLTIPDDTYSKVHKREFGMDTNNNVRILLNVYFGN
jgi:hypothetical protein